MKIDLRKVYESVSWKFPDQCRSWILTCVSSPSFFISINGGLCGFFKWKKGLWKGDHIFLLPFVLIMEYFTRIMKKTSKRDEFCFHYRCKSLKLNHLIFADDLMLFCKGGVKSVTLMARALKAFSNASGMKANNEKSVIHFSNVPKEMKIRIMQVTGFQM